jgi:hypothetical protein
MIQSQDDFVSITLAELCERTTVPRDVIERNLLATQQEHLFQKSQMQIWWELLIADLPAFHAYLKQNEAVRPESELAARADVITIAIWRAAPRQRTNNGVTERLRRIQSCLETLRSKTSSDETGERVSRALKNFPYLEAENEFHDAFEKIRPDRVHRRGNSVSLLTGRSPTVSEEWNVSTPPSSLWSAREAE